MMQLSITHETCYDYVPAVTIAQHMAYLRPLSNARQRLLSHHLHIAPDPAQQSTTTDVYGNTRHFFSLQSAHSQLRVTASSVVETFEPVPSCSEIAWEPVRERLRYCAKQAFDAASEFVFASPYVPRHSDFAMYARASFPEGRPLLLAARDLMQRIHQDFVYDNQSTQVNTPALQALAQRKGVCQDFAHIMIGCLRALGLPARYVSGYLLTHPAPGQTRLIGSDASHAWVAVYLPDLPGDDVASKWHDFDPTNNRDGWGCPSPDYVTLAIGRDYADVSPIRGVIHGGASHTLTVGVTVEPYEPFPTREQAPTYVASQSQSQSQSQSAFDGQSQSQSAIN